MLITRPPPKTTRHTEAGLGRGDKSLAGKDMEISERIKSFTPRGLINLIRTFVRRFVGVEANRLVLIGERAWIFG